jgi:hypothetical protein
MKRFYATLLALALTACGGGGGGGDAPAPVVVNASPGGIWTGTDSVSGLTVLGIVDELGEGHFIRTDYSQYIGTATTAGNQVSGSFEGFTEFGTAFQDGSTHATGTISGTIVERSSVTLATSFRTDANTPTSGTLNLSFNALYNRASSLATLSGNFVDASSGVVATISSGGVIFYQNPSSGCVLNGTATLINASYNAYRIAVSYASCQGQYAALNGVPFTGLATLDNTVTPERIIVGLHGTVGATKYALVLLENRT